ncbi:MAG: DNA replication and repair protein RecF [Treponema sp.]|jgi:DNA replication and repair protein RecF|nr:DNA replication and repair protein RecF [Treponema sp.]
MLFSSLRTSYFRNLANTEVFTGSKNVFLVGENGQGKTNFLEALYFCAYASSFRTFRDYEIAFNGKIDFSAAVKITQSVNDEIFIKSEKGKKHISINGKIAEDRKDLLSIAPTIVFCHEDMEFVSGPPERRRWFFDQTLSLYDPVYLEDLRRYRRVLKSRNTVLREYSQREADKSNTEKILDALDPQLAEYGNKIMEKRETAAHDFSAVFTPLYKEVAKIDQIKVKYVNSWKTGNKTTDCFTTDNAFAALHKRRSADMTAGFTLSGPHRDQYIFEDANSQEFSVKASTGQRRLLALLLRTAQAERFSQVTAQLPVLLLDDVLLEMDSEKRRRFLTVLPAYDQAFYTFLPDEPYQNYCKEDTLIYKVCSGMIKQ